MNKIMPFRSLLSVFSCAVFLASCSSQGDSSAGYYQRGTSQVTEEVGYDEGYQWAEDNDTDSFDDCDDQFGTGDAEDGCNKYVQENKYDETPTFNGDDCTEDCSGHEAGYKWAEDNGIDDTSDCDGNSDSFNEGCESYVEEQ